MSSSGRTSRLGRLALLLTLTGCDVEPREPLDLDELDEPEPECLTVVEPSLELGLELHRFVSDGPGSRGGWGLVTLADDLLALVRLPASPTEPPTAPIQLELRPSQVDAFDLRAGTPSGTAWLLSRGTNSARLRRLDPGVGVSANNGQLANFPGTGLGSTCPQRWNRELLLIEGRPYLLAMPDCSEGPGLEFYLLELSPSELDFAASWELAFDPCIAFPDVTSCVTEFGYRVESVSPGRSTRLPNASRVSLPFVQVREFVAAVSDLRSTDISLLDLRMSEVGPDARLITFREVYLGTVAPSVEPVELAQDAFALQLFVRSRQPAFPDVLVRIDTVADDFRLTNAANLPFAADALVQLERESALVRTTPGGDLEAISLAEVTRWGDWDTMRYDEPGDLVAVDSAGPGHLLLHRRSAPPQLVAAACVGTGQ